MSGFPRGYAVFGRTLEFLYFLFIYSLSLLIYAAGQFKGHANLDWVSVYIRKKPKSAPENRVLPLQQWHSASSQVICESIERNPA